MFQEIIKWLLNGLWEKSIRAPFLAPGFKEDMDAKKAGCFAEQAGGMPGSAEAEPGGCAVGGAENRVCRAVPCIMQADPGVCPGICDAYGIYVQSVL